MTSLPRSCSRPAEVRGLGVGAGALGQGAGDGGHLAGVHVQQPARGAAGARGELEEAADGGLEREAPDAHAADEGDGLADGLRADGARARGGVGEAQDVGGEPGVGLERGDELVGVGLGVAGELADAPQGAIEHRQLADALDGVLQLGVDARGMSGRGVHRPAPDRRQQRPGVERRAPRGPRSGPAGAGGRSALGGWADAGAPAPGLVGRAALRLVDLGRDHRVLLTNTRVGWMRRGGHHPSVRSRG